MSGHHGPDRLGFTLQECAAGKVTCLRACSKSSIPGGSRLALLMRLEGGVDLAGRSSVCGFGHLAVAGGEHAS